MFKTVANKYSIAILLLIGIALRLFLFSVNPATNGYDNHREPISIYAQSFDRPSPLQCWECYQPPVYYYCAAAVYKLSEQIGLTDNGSWKLVQFINPLLSIIVFLLFYFILSEFNLSKKQKILYLSFMLVLPRDILTSAMIGNDYLLTFSSVATLLYYIKCIKNFGNENKKKFLISFIVLNGFTTLGCLTKQHGLLLIIFPASILFFYLFKNKRFCLTVLFPVFIFALLISLSEEYRSYTITGKFLVSNQHLFDEAKAQFPVTLDKVEFFSFRVCSLFQKPFISYSTAASLPTSLFASTFFDYEWKFLSPRYIEAIIVGRIAYLLGISWMFYFIVTTFNWIKRKLKTTSRITFQSLYYAVPVIVALLFICVPVIQTIRFPHYSSMKATFMLPGIIILLAMHARLVINAEIKSNYTSLLTSFNIIFGVVLLFTIYSLIDLALSNPISIS